MSRRSHLIVALGALASSLALLACAGTRAARAQDEPLPALGDYVYVEQLPQVIERVAPVFPAITAGVSGVVQVQALVGKDGLVKDTRVMKSIPMLDAAAVEAVRQWRFKPALSNGRPVACWIAIPIAFNVDGRALDDSLRGVPTPPVEPRLVFRGGYRINHSATDTLVVTRDAHEGVALLCPGEWKGAGRFVDGTYRGTFQYLRTAKDARNRGARGTHTGTFGTDGVMRVTGHFTNRPWRDFRVEWSLTDTPLSFYGGRGRRFNDRTPQPERIILGEDRSTTPYENPTWPPQSRTQADSTHEHPLWPPEHTRRDFQTVPASTDSTKH